MGEKIMNVKDALYEYVIDPKTWFYWYHNPKRLEALHNSDDTCSENDIWRFKSFDDKQKDIEIQEDLHDFFEAVLDEVRLKKANDFCGICVIHIRQ